MLGFKMFVPQLSPLCWRLLLAFSCAFPSGLHGGTLAPQPAPEEGESLEFLQAWRNSKDSPSSGAGCGASVPPCKPDGKAHEKAKRRRQHKGDNWGTNILKPSIFQGRANQNKLRRARKEKFLVHLKESEWRFNHRQVNLYSIILKQSRHFPL